MTLLIHLGYLTYEEVSDSYDDVLVHDGKMFIGLVKIPNEEIWTEFQKLLRRSKHEKLIGLVRNSDQLLQDTIMGNSNAVADAIQKLSETNYAPAFRNNEQSLRYLIKIFEII